MELQVRGNLERRRDPQESASSHSCGGSGCPACRAELAAGFGSVARQSRTKVVRERVWTTADRNTGRRATAASSTARVGHVTTIRILTDPNVCLELVLDANHPFVEIGVAGGAREARSPT